MGDIDGIILPANHHLPLAIERDVLLSQYWKCNTNRQQ
jgi:hypothetical protein